ncbi:MAG: hypothetical protein WCL06_16415, partial [Bacteroidota bacterium]
AKETKKIVPIKEVKKEIPAKVKKEVKKVVAVKGKKPTEKIVLLKEKKSFKKNEESPKDKKKSKNEVVWLKKLQDTDYPAANSFLQLLYNEPAIIEIIKKMKAAPYVDFKAKDIFRAANVSTRGVSKNQVELERKKIKKGVPLSPIMLVRDFSKGKLIIADGYHRLCAVYACNEDSIVPCKIV